ncbi:MAG: ADP-ribosylation factor-like protein [Acidobacteriota bacterium]
MAQLDPETGHFSLQIVYDGAPESGKTSSVVSLGRLLQCPVVTPGEIRGRTVFFDWMDYVGGACRGRPIQCRVLTVPSQDEFAARRRVIMDSADAVLFVVDSSAARFGDSQERFFRLLSDLEQRRRKIPVVLQVNKRDAPDALPFEEILDALDPDLESVESIATKGWGIREAFVVLVSSAIRALQSSDALRSRSVFETQEMQLPDPEQLRELLDHI